MQWFKWAILHLRKIKKNDFALKNRYISLGKTKCKKMVRKTKINYENVNSNFITT